MRSSAIAFGVGCEFINGQIRGEARSDCLPANSSAQDTATKAPRTLTPVNVGSGR
jgi:hypothetical protein